MPNWSGCGPITGPGSKSGRAGLAVAVEGTNAHIEKKIDLPESWVAGFLQVHGTMTLGLTRLRLAPVDLYNICRFPEASPGQGLAPRPPV